MRERMRPKIMTTIGNDSTLEISEIQQFSDCFNALPVPRIVWGMVPSGSVTDSVIANLGALFESGDLIIDGGENSPSMTAVAAFHSQFGGHGVRTS